MPNPKQTHVPLGLTRPVDTQQREIDPANVNVPLGVIERRAVEAQATGFVGESALAAQYVGAIAQKEVFLGRVIGQGPNGEEDYEDARYWVELSYISNSDGDPSTEATLQAWDESNPRRRVLTVTNLPEAGEGTHELEVGAAVVFYRMVDWSIPGIPRWFMLEASRSGIAAVVVREWFFGERFLSIARVSEDDNGNITIAESTETMRTWFGTSGEHYEYVASAASEFGDSVTVQPAYKIGGRWYVQQSPGRMPTVTPDAEFAPPTDCNVATA